MCKLLNICLLFGLIALLNISAYAQAGDTTNLGLEPEQKLTKQQHFDSAAEAYEAREYDKAAEHYQNILAQGVESGPLYFNLGNAAFKAGDLGYAILYYHRALKLKPGDENIISNLEFAKLFTSLQMEGVELNPVSNFFESLVAPYRLDSLAWGSTIFFVLLILLMILRYALGYNGYLLKSGLIISLILLISVGSLTSFKYRTDYLKKQAVLIADDCPVRTGPSESLDIELQAAPGLVVEILSESGEYYSILFENKRRGWIRKDLVAEI